MTPRPIRTKINLSIGDTFGRLVVSGEIFRNQGATDSPLFVQCRCGCGALRDVRIYDLVGGKTTSCGCWTGEKISKARSTHGQRKTKLYVVWHKMKDRCTNQKSKDYPRYGGRGIAVCEEWRTDFAVFSAWARENGYQEGLLIDRRKNNEGYCPENCWWTTNKVQARNRSSNRPLTAFGRTMTIPEWVEQEECCISAPTARSKSDTLRSRIENHWIPEDAISTPSWGQPSRAESIKWQIIDGSSLLADQEIAQEVWKFIPGWPRYEVSDLGRIRSHCKSTGPKILGTTVDKRDGRRYVTLSGVTKPYPRFLVARLVLLAFVGEPPDPAMEACHHPDPNPGNNRLDNLRWDTRAENNRDRSRLNEMLLAMNSC